MKKALLLLSIGLAGCGGNSHTDDVALDYKVVVIDGCEYVVADYYVGHLGYGFMAHKGNCKNHR